MSNTLLYLCFLLLSTVRFIGPVRRWLGSGTEKPTGSNFAKITVFGLTSMLTGTWFRLLLLAAGIMFAVERIKDIQYVREYAKPPQIPAWQLLTLSDEQVPRYVRIPDFVPVETTVEETRTRLFIPMGKNLVYAADVAQSMPDDTVEMANVLTKLIDPDTKKPILSLFVTQEEGIAPVPEPDEPREVTGLVETYNTMNTGTENLFREGGYEVNSKARLISEGVLPDPPVHLYAQLVLLILLAMAQPITYILQRNQEAGQ